MPSKFVHLRLHSEYSIVDGIVRLDELMATLAKRGMNAVALTDACNLFAAVKFYNQAMKKGIKPILGADLIGYFATAPKDHSALTLLCLDNVGYKNLTCLISDAYQKGQVQGKPLLHYEWLEGQTEGLIALSGGRNGLVGKALLQQDMAKAKTAAEFFMHLFPNRFYLEIQRTNRPNETLYNQLLVNLANELHLPLVATNEVCFLDADDFDAHEARVCIHQGVTLAHPNRPLNYSREQYLRTADEMAALFHDLPEALANTVQIATRCSIQLDLGKNYLPSFPIPDGSSIDAYLSLLSKEGLEKRLTYLFNPEDLLIQRTAYDERLHLELTVINSMGFPGYFLIVADFIQWAKDHGVPVGPGRGSGAGSLVAYALGITDLDPLAYELLFERFLNPERVSMPDFDIDFCMEGRDRVIEYVAEKYGRQAVSQIITFGTMAAKAVIRDVGRVLSLPYGFVDKIAKLIPFEIGITLSKALQDEAELNRLYQDDEEVKDLINLAKKLEGITRNAGKHAGGVVIAPSKLTDFTAIYCEEGSTHIVSQFDKDDVEAVGLVKFDFLGLRTLTIIDWALRTINQERANLDLPPIDISRIPTDDAPTFVLLKACETTAVFQLESRGMKELIHRLQPDNFEEIIALVALFRPGPLQSGMVDDFIDRKHGRAPVLYPHPDLEPILKPTYGVILYQEQVMQIAQVLANYTLGAADLLRRAMGKKKPEEMAEQRAIFTEGATKRAVSLETATHIFDLMEKFAGYGFNKSHSAAYALVAYQTAWLKTHYPAAFMAAVMSSDMDNTDKVVTFIHECATMRLTINPPSVNRSHYQFTVADKKSLWYGLGAIKGVGESAVHSMVEELKLGGEYLSLFDFCQRLDGRKVNKRVVETLIKAGAMDEWGLERSSLFASIETAFKMAEQVQKNRSSGQLNFLAMLNDDAPSEDYTLCKPWPTLQRLKAEKETLGHYISGHPVAPYADEFKAFITPIKALNPHASKKAVVCGLITQIRRILTKRGNKLTIIGLEDPLASIDVVVFSELFDALKKPLEIDQIILIEGDISTDTFSGGVKITASQIFTIEETRSRFAKWLTLQVNQSHQTEIPILKSLLNAHLGDCPVRLHYRNEFALGTLATGNAWQVTPSDRLLELLRDLLGEQAVGVEY